MCSPRRTRARLPGPLTTSRRWRTMAPDRPLHGATWRNHAAARTPRETLVGGCPLFSGLDATASLAALAAAGVEVEFPAGRTHRPPGRDRDRLLHHRRRPRARGPRRPGARAPGPGRLLRGAVRARRWPRGSPRSSPTSRPPASLSPRGTSSASCATIPVRRSRCFAWLHPASARRRPTTGADQPEDRSDVTPERPTGVVTFLFTDIEGSTRLVARIGDAAYGEVLETERRLVVDASTGCWRARLRFRGRCPLRGLRVARRCRPRGDRRPAGHPGAHLGRTGRSAVRMGIHTGEASLVDDDYLGFEVHRAARVASVAHGGQVLVSGPTRVLAGTPGDGIGFRDLGEHRLKDVAEPEHLYQVEAPGLRDDFPPPTDARRACRATCRCSSPRSSVARPSPMRWRSSDAHPPPDADRARRDGQDAPLAGPGIAVRRGVSGRRLVRAARRRH